MTVYTGDPYGRDQRNQRSQLLGFLGGGFSPMNQQQMPRRMLGGPSKGGAGRGQMPMGGGFSQFGGYNQNSQFRGGPSKGGYRQGMDAPIDLSFKQRQLPHLFQPLTPPTQMGGESDWRPMASSADIGLNGRPSVDNSGKFINNETGEVRVQPPEEMNDYSSYLDFYNNKSLLPVGNNPPQMGEGGYNQRDLAAKQLGIVSQPAFEIQPGNPEKSNGLIQKLQEPSQNYNSNFAFEQPTRPANQEMMSGEVERLSRENMMAHDQQNENLKQAVQGGFGMPPAQINQLGPTNPMQFPQPQPPDFSYQPFLRTQGPMNMPQPIMRNAASRFYGGGITDLYPR